MPILLRIPEIASDATQATIQTWHKVAASVEAKMGSVIGELLSAGETTSKENAPQAAA